MRNQLLIAQGKLLSKLIQTVNLGNGSTWPGHIALKFNRNIIGDLLHNSQLKIIFIVGTNGKTTTTTLLQHILKESGKKVLQNRSGANMLNGIASTLLLHATPSGKIEGDIALFEIDENAFPAVCKEITPDAVIILNLFRDQLDRYGEVNTIALNWQEALRKLPETTQLLLNSDDPQIAFLGKNAKQKVSYFGIDEPDSKLSTIDHASDSTYCPNCGEKLNYAKRYYSHIGIWSCPSCGFNHPQEVFTHATSYPLHGLYNKYNIHAALLTSLFLGVPQDKIASSLSSFKPAFGRQEVVEYLGKMIEIILAKNPAGFNQAIQTILEQKVNHLLLVLNDRIADGTDVSWIWDINIELLNKVPNLSISVSGDRVYDLSLRLKYAGIPQEMFIIEPNLEQAIKNTVESVSNAEKLFILPTYTAMLEVRKILTGKKIL